jgi:hypothetical protein
LSGKGIRSIICTKRLIVEEQELFLLTVDIEIKQKSLEVQAFKAKQWSMYERLKEMEKTMQE